MAVKTALRRSIFVSVPFPRTRAIGGHGIPSSAILGTPLFRAASVRRIDSATALFSTGAPVSEKALWANKRQLQKRDVALARSGKVKQSDMQLFTPAHARNAKVLNGPY